MREGGDGAAGDAVPGRHTCATYQGEDAFLSLCLAFLQEGVESGDRLVYVSERSERQMLGDVARLGTKEQLVDTGVLTLLSYGEVDVVPHEQFQHLAEATERAVADGHRGLRIAAELSGLVTDPQRRASLLRYEHLAGAYMSRHPMSALCLVSRTVVPEDDVADLQAVHPVLAPGEAGPAFRLLPDTDGLRLTGAVEAWDADRLAGLLRAVTPRGGDVRLHLHDLDFIGVRGLLSLADFSGELARDGGRLTVVGAPRPVVRAASVLGVTLGEQR